MNPQTEQGATTSTDVDPFEVLDVRPLWSSLPAFILTSPLTAAGFAGAFTISPFALPFYKKLPLPLKDRVTRAVLFWLLLPTKLRIRVVDHNDSRDDHAQLYVAPHGCIIDPLALMRVLGHVRPVVAAMSKDLPIASTFVDATDPIYVERAKTSEDKGPSVVEQLRESIETTVRGRQTDHARGAPLPPRHAALEPTGVGLRHPALPARRDHRRADDRRVPAYSDPQRSEAT